MGADRMALKLGAFFQIEIATQPLTIVRRSMTTARPGNDMIGVHFFIAECLAADRTDTVLALVSRPFVSLGKGADRPNEP